jgi:hypothetical protein
MNTSTSTQAEQFAERYAAGMAKDVLHLIAIVRWLAYGVMIAAMVVSYGHQTTYLHSIGVSILGARIIPIALDLLTAICVKVAGTRGVIKAAKVIALRTLVFPVLISGAINFVAPGTRVAKLVMVVPVAMIPLAEIVASKIRPDFTAMAVAEREVAPAVETVDPELAAKRSDAARKAADTRRANADKAAEIAAAKQAARKARAAERAALETAYDLPAAPVSPAPIAWDRVQQMLDKAQTA